MKKVVVAIDVARSYGNDNCIKTAQDIAKAIGGALTILHVIEPIPKYVVPSMPKGILTKQKLEAEKEIRELAAKYDCSDVVVLEGVPANRILEYASQNNADLIVVNSHDPGLSDYIFGSVARRVVRHARCSVHVVRDRNITK